MENKAYFETKEIRVNLLRISSNKWEVIVNYSTSIVIFEFPNREYAKKKFKDLHNIYKK